MRNRTDKSETAGWWALSRKAHSHTSRSQPNILYPPCCRLLGSTTSTSGVFTPPVLTLYHPKGIYLCQLTYLSSVVTELLAGPHYLTASRTLNPPSYTVFGCLRETHSSWTYLFSSVLFRKGGFYPARCVTSAETLYQLAIVLPLYFLLNLSTSDQPLPDSTTQKRNQFRQTIP